MQRIVERARRQLCGDRHHRQPGGRRNGGDRERLRGEPTGPGRRRHGNGKAAAPADRP